GSSVSLIDCSMLLVRQMLNVLLSRLRARGAGPCTCAPHSCGDGRSLPTTGAGKAQETTKAAGAAGSGAGRPAQPRSALGLCAERPAAVQVWCGALCGEVVSAGALSAAVVFLGGRRRFAGRE